MLIVCDTFSYSSADVPRCPAGEWSSSPLVWQGITSYHLPVYPSRSHLIPTDPDVRLQGLLYFNTRLRLLERRQQRIKELRLKHERLRLELDDAKTQLMLDADRWNGKCESMTSPGNGVLLVRDSCVCVTSLCPFVSLCLFVSLKCLSKVLCVFM